MRRAKACWWLCCFCLWLPLRAAETLPAPPARYFNDFARVVSATAGERLNRKLEDFEKATSSQVLVVVFPALPPNASMEDYTIRLARRQTWAASARTRTP